MKPLILEPTDFTPGIILDHINKKFLINGYSRPEDVKGFYKPVLDWINQFSEEVLCDYQESEYFENNGINFDFELKYFNSSSAKCLIDILIKLLEFNSRGFNIQIKWYYDQGDETILEAGEELSNAIEFPFEFIEQ